MEILDLHYVKEDLDMGISAEGVLYKNSADITKRIEAIKKTVKTINLNFQTALKKVPLVIQECTQLEKLNISHTGITEIPDFIFELPNLKDLSCCCSFLKNFPYSVFKAQKLERLHIRINKDWIIPKKIPVLPELKILEVDLYTSMDLPSNLGILKKLETLTIVTKYTEGDVPPLLLSFKDHPSLKEVSIIDPFYRYRKSLDLAQIAKMLSTCKNIESLKLCGYSVGEKHEALSLLKNLKVLELRHLLQEGNIFDSIKDLNNLEKLGIWGSEFKITQIPDIFSNMSELQEFSFAGNMIKELPLSLYNLPKLKILEIGSTGISLIDDKIGSLKTLEQIHIYDCILDRLPNSIFELPNLRILNIEENIFSESVISKIRENINTLIKNGQKILFTYDRQGYRQMIKKLRVCDDDSMSMEAYVKFCLNAIKENPNAIKYVNAEKLNSYYAQLCMAVVKQSCFALENIDPEALGKQYYKICMEGAKSHDIGNAFKFIREEFLTDKEYLLVCLEAALHNRSSDFLNYFNTDAFQKRFNKEVYDRVCWVAILHNPRTAAKKI
ncbi:MAG: hypothetical protein FWB86_01635 [Treponema sp.]|nr:hypothetical protein [Treponema sp.]MCL2250815.1 hypothetical protein [Treponema sp.]